MIEFRVEPNAIPIVGVAGPVPGLRIQGYSRGRIDEPTNQREPSKYIVSGVSASVSIGGVSIPFVTVESGLHYGNSVGNMLNQDLKCLVQLPRYLLDAIEGTRVHDLQISVSIELRYHFVGGGPHEMLQSAQGYMQLNISQKQWLDALAQMGYAAGWVLEVERPQIEGWDNVAAFLDKAADRIASRDPEGAIAQCRAAWRSLVPLLDARWDGIATEIDRGSTPEPSYPPKSARISAIREGALKWAHTGDHPETYAASMDDALLAYRLTASLISFLSRKAVLAEAHSTIKTPKA
jgi:hypothetical protein